MEFVRRPTVLATIAAGLLAINLVWLMASGSADPGPVIDDPLAGATASPGESGTADDAGDPGSDGGTPSEAPTGEAAPDDGAAGDGAQDEPTSEDPDDATSQPLVAPMEGRYTYASSGSWSFDGEEHQLPATATGTVSTDGDQWSLHLVAGQEYADRFTFTIGADGGLDWDVWVLERTIDGRTEPAEYTCSAETAWYRPGADVGRTLTHVCDTAQGSVSTGEVEFVGTEEVTLGDGTVVAADHIVYRTTDSSSSDQYEISGQGRLDIWLDPETGLRVQERRSSQTTTTQDGQDFVYTEEVSFLLQSMTPDA